MLGLAAQHLTLCSAADYSVQALNHRVLAIKALNEALSKPCITRSDADARYAAIMALTYQSSYMADGMMDFLAMMRGWMVIQMTVMPAFADSPFRCFTRDAYVASMRSLISASIDNTHEDRRLDDFSASLRTVAPLCQSVAEVTYLSTMEQIVKLAGTSATEGENLPPPYLCIF
jgi:hypothetical protein